MKYRLASVLLLLAAGPALAQDDAAERERIGRERAAAEARFTEQEKTCRARFAVTDCVNKATRERNAALSELRRQERILDAEERQRRAAQRQQELDERNSPEQQKAAADRRAKALADRQEREARAAEKAAARAEKEAGRAAAAPREQAAKGEPQPQGKPRQARSPGTQGPTAEEAAKNRAAYEARQLEAQQHKAEVAARNAKRSKPPAGDLPPPPR